MKKTIIFILAFSMMAILLFGCSRGSVNTEDTAAKAASTSGQASADKTTAVTKDIDSGIKESDSLTKEIDSSDIDNIDKDLSEINW